MRALINVRLDCFCAFGMFVTFVRMFCSEYCGMVPVFRTFDRRGNELSEQNVEKMMKLLSPCVANNGLLYKLVNRLV